MNRQLVITVLVLAAIGGTGFYLLHSSASKSTNVVAQQASAAPATSAPVSQPEQQSEQPRLRNLTMEDVAERCGEPSGQRVGLVSFMDYRDITLQFDYKAYKKEVNLSGWASYHNGHRSDLSQQQLITALPCLLRGEQVNTTSAEPKKISRSKGIWRCEVPNGGTSQVSILTANPPQMTLQLLGYSANTYAPSIKLKNGTQVYANTDNSEFMIPPTDENPVLGVRDTTGKQAFAACKRLTCAEALPADSPMLAHCQEINGEDVQ